MTKKVEFALIMMLLAYFCAQIMTPLNAEELTNGKTVVVAVVEPRDTPVEIGERNHMVTVGNSPLVTTSSVLDGLGSKLANNKNAHLAILLHKDIPAGTLTDLVSIAGKAGYNAANISIYIFSNTRWMMPIPGFKVVDFTIDPKKLAEIVD